MYIVVGRDDRIALGVSDYMSAVQEMKGATELIGIGTHEVYLENLVGSMASMRTRARDLPIKLKVPEGIMLAYVTAKWDLICMDKMHTAKMSTVEQEVTQMRDKMNSFLEWLSN